MEIIFTLILLIGIGINSHRYDARKYEVPKQEVISFIEEDFSKETNQLQVLNNNESETDLHNKLSDAVQNRETRKMELKGKYISVRINDGNG
jgi:hypothetical protein